MIKTHDLILIRERTPEGVVVRWVRVVSHEEVSPDGTQPIYVQDITYHGRLHKYPRGRKVVLGKNAFIERYGD